MQSELAFSQLNEFFSGPQAQKTASAIKFGTEIAIQVEGLAPFCLRKTEKVLGFFAEKPASPDLTFYLGVDTPALLMALKNEEVTALGLSIFKLMVSDNPREKIKVAVHADFFRLITNGYFKVLAQGGPEVMRFLAEKGFGNFSKIKSSISQTKEK